MLGNVGPTIETFVLTLLKVAFEVDAAFSI